MPLIHVLNQDTINKIAAGEVIERPMAVVKELVENAIDAGANSVTVEIKEGGTSLIRITDNGTGMKEDDIRLAFTPHATSKIADASDLLSVGTLGFRGEALASIASVSQLEMVTKTRESLTGIRYSVDGGEEKNWEEVGCPDGTTFLVRNLFYNTPARLKFLKTPATEAGYINSLVERLALSHPEISFRFINQNQPKLHTSGNNQIKDSIYQIYGREITANLIEVNASEISCEVKGFIGKPIISRGNRNYMNYFINGRYIKSSVIHKAIEDAYAPYSMQHRYPFTVLQFTIDSSKIDINVHPQKMEIRFTDGKGVYQSVFHAISQALKHREYIPEVNLNTEPAKRIPAKPVTERAPEPFEKKREKQQIKQSLEILERFKQQSKQLQNSRPSEEKAERKLEQNTEPVQPEKEIEHKAEVESRSVPNMVQETPKDYGKKENNPKPVQETLFEEGILSPKAQKEIRIIGQVFNTYWILQYENAMYLVDQHAAHEKVLYEHFVKKIKENKVMTQLVTPPVIITLSMIEEQAVKDNISIFKQLGYQIEPFGGKEYAVSGVPAHLPSVGNEELLLEIIDSLSEEHGRKAPDVLLDKIASMSCKAAVKGNNKLPVEEMEELLRELMTLENPYHCPHGRPTMVKMTKQELDKKFKRIL